jgi:hypothetical protein
MREQDEQRPEQAVPKVVPVPTVLFPGEVVTITNGTRFTVRPWGVKALSRDIPDIFGRILGHVSGLSSTSVESIVAVLVANSMAEVIELVAFTCGVDKERDLLRDDVLAEDLLALLVATVRQNKGFFERLSELREVFGRDLLPSKKLPRTPSPSNSSGQASPSQNSGN